ncbi:MAG: hypothetical protein WC635_10470 [Bacteriovorax sp.]|jgi:hypothetical protein
MEKLLFYMFLFSLLILPQISFAEILKSVEVTGNKRTTKSSIIQHGHIEIGHELSEEDLRKIKEHLGRVNQIHLKKIEFMNGVLSIDIEEKWTLFPVPMITESGNYHNRGFLIYEDNFMGTLGTFAPGVSWSNSIFNAILYYQDESLFSHATGMKILLMRKSDYVEFKRVEKTVNIHESRYDLYMITPNYLYENQVFKAGPVYIDKKIYSESGAQIFQDQSRGIFFRHHLNAYQTMEVMYEGLVTTYDLYTLRSGNHWIFRNEADARWSFPRDGNFFNFGVHGHHVNNGSFLFPKYLGGEEGYRGYDKSSLPASANAGAYAQYQQHLFHRIYLSPFFEYNSSKLINDIHSGSSISENTIGVGLRYYFKKISIPAVIFDYAKNINDKSDHFHINVGVNL